jgi:hypothetical protein
VGLCFGGRGLGGWLQQRAAPQDCLEQGLVESHSALVTAWIAIDILHHRQTTSAAAPTAVEDMGQRIADAARALEPVCIGSSDDQTDRDLVLAAVDAGEAALLTARDELKVRGDTDPGSARWRGPVCRPCPGEDSRRAVKKVLGPALGS